MFSNLLLPNNYVPPANINNWTVHLIILTVSTKYINIRIAYMCV